MGTRERESTAIDHEARVVRGVVADRTASDPPVVGRVDEAAVASLAQIDEYAARLDTVAPLELHCEVEFN